MKPIHLIACLTVFSVIASCSSRGPSYNTKYPQNAWHYWNTGNYPVAFTKFSICAGNGDSNCMNNIGVMYGKGQVAGGVNLVRQKEWYTLSARHGNAYAIQNLSQMGEPIPSADLVVSAKPEVRSEVRPKESSSFFSDLGTLLNAFAPAITGYTEEKNRQRAAYLRNNPTSNPSKVTCESKPNYNGTKVITTCKEGY